MPQFSRAWRMFASGLPFVILASATSIPRYSFEELTDRSEFIVSGEVTRSWPEWDAAHQFIWTRHELSITGALKGATGSTIVLSEPGGVIGVEGMSVAGAVIYRPGDKVLVFLERMPNGYLRTTGWGQGKYAVDMAGLLHAGASLATAEIVERKAVFAGVSLRSMDGMSVAELKSRVSARVRFQQAAGRAQ